MTKSAIKSVMDLSIPE